MEEGGISPKSVGPVGQGSIAWLFLRDKGLRALSGDGGLGDGKETLLALKGGDEVLLAGWPFLSADSQPL